MRAVIYTGGEVFPERVSERPSETDLTIAADAGLVTARAFGVVPKILVGDFDSLGDPSGFGLPPEVEILKVPAEKDETDTELAVSIALSRGAKEILMVGGIGGRLDHSLANLALLEALERRGVPATMTNGKTRARFFGGGTVTIPKDPHFRYLSLIPADEEVEGVTLTGCKYPLQNATLYRRNTAFSTSNEITESVAALTVDRGGLWILECGE